MQNRCTVPAPATEFPRARSGQRLRCVVVHLEGAARDGQPAPISRLFGTYYERVDLGAKRTRGVETPN